MSPVDRFTRDGASKYVWAGLALVALIGLAFAVTAGGRAVDDERAASQGRAVGYVDQVLAPRLQGHDLAAPITGLDGRGAPLDPLRHARLARPHLVGRRDAPVLDGRVGPPRIQRRPERPAAPRDRA